MDRIPHILVVDDHREIRELLAQYLAQHGLRVSTANGGAQLREQLQVSAPDLVVLDIMMPGEDGLSLCRWLRASSRLPVILLTAVAEDADRIVGLEMGADDYVTKPFNPRELLARIRAVLRRAQAPASGELSPETPHRYRFGGWTFDLDRRELDAPDGTAVAISAAEFRLLQALVERPGRVLTRDQLLDITAGRSAELFDRSIDNIVSRLRRKIETDPKDPQLIRTVWGEGYALVASVEALS